MDIKLLESIKYRLLKLKIPLEHVTMSWRWIGKQAAVEKWNIDSEWPYIPDDCKPWDIMVEITMTISIPQFPTLCLIQSGEFEKQAVESLHNSMEAQIESFKKSISTGGF